MMTDEVISVAKTLMVLTVSTRSAFALAVRLVEIHPHQKFDQPKKSLEEIVKLVIESTSKMAAVGLPIEDAVSLAVRLLELDMFTKVANAAG